MSFAILSALRVTRICPVALAGAVLGACIWAVRPQHTDGPLVADIHRRPT